MSLHRVWTTYVGGDSCVSFKLFSCLFFIQTISLNFGHRRKPHTMTTRSSNKPSCESASSSFFPNENPVGLPLGHVRCRSDQLIRTSESKETQQRWVRKQEMTKFLKVVSDIQQNRIGRKTANILHNRLRHFPFFPQGLLVQVST